MAYERFYKALEGYEAAIEHHLRAEDIERDEHREVLVDFAAKLFDALFDHYP